jgi:hypothetical protein
MSLWHSTRRFLAKSQGDKLSAATATLRSLVDRPSPRGADTAAQKWLLDNAETIRRRVSTLATIEAERYRSELLADPQYQDRRRLPPFGFRVYSQNDEDGIIQEIFARIGVTSRTFVEFGVEGGLENNTLKLLLEGWSGLWLEGSERYVRQIERTFADVVADGRLQVRHAFIMRENINQLIGECRTGEIDLLSIDVDGNDVHLLEALDVINPRVVVIEYNAKFPPPLSIAPVYDPDHRWTGTDYMGASLAAVAKIAERKGFALVGCNIVGANAFLVRQDLLGDKFCAPYTAENHYQPARYFLLRMMPAGHRADWRPYISV